MMSLRIAVVGVGHLGRHHARILSSLPGVELVAVVDINQRAGGGVAAASGTRPVTDYRDLLGQVDAVTLAVPTELHREIALPFLAAGVHVLVEKPMARSLAEADDMIARGRRRPARPRRRPDRALQSGRRSGAAAADAIRGSSRSIGSARFPSAASTSTSSSI